MSLKYIDISWYIDPVGFAVVRNLYDNRCRDWQPWTLLLFVANVAMLTVITCWRASGHVETIWNHYVQSLYFAWEREPRQPKQPTLSFTIKKKCFLSSCHLCTEAACDGVTQAFAATILLPRVEKAWGTSALSVKGLHHRICSLSTKGTPRRGHVAQYRQPS